MPKNAVQRLRKIENDIKTVISLYDISNKNNNDKPEASKKQDSQQLSEIGTPKRLENVPPVNKFRGPSRQSKSSLHNAFQKNRSFVTRSSQGMSSRQPKIMPKPGEIKLTKPVSAPSSTSTLSPLSETDFWQQVSTPNTSEKSIHKVKTSGNLNTDWFDPSFHEYDLVMSPSKTIETAKEVLAKHSFKKNKEFQEYKHTCSDSVSKKETETFKKQIPDTGLHVKTNTDKKNVTVNPKLKKEAENQKKVAGKRRSVPSKAGAPMQSETNSERNRPFSSEVYSYEKHENHVIELSPALFTMARKLPCKVVTSKENHGPADNPHSEGMKTKTSDKFKPRAKEEDMVAGDKTDEKPVRNNVDDEKANKNTSSNQKTRKTVEGDDELRAHGFSKIIERNNARMEKMRMSKELALQIAKQLKTKYDEIQNSRKELMDKLKRVEQENVKLHIEVQEVRESKKKLQLQIEALIDAKAKLLEQDVRAKDLHQENVWLKSKLGDLEKQYNVDITEKQRKIDEIQRERLEDTQRSLKNREAMAEEIQKLTTEKSQLLSKFEDLRMQLQDRQTKIATLEENIRKLEAEVTKQKQNLQIKTDSLHETNLELETIRQNSHNLEEQVKTLRKRIEKFEEIQYNITKKNEEYEKEIKANEEEIQQLQEKSIRLKKELEDEKDALLIKVKIIEDQQETIAKLKEKSEDAKVLLRKNQSLERVLNIEREEKLELQEAVQNLKWRKEELKKKVKCLENDLLLAPQEVVRDLKKTQFVLHELENQVQKKQKEWELQMQALMREKEEACTVAEFATKKLMQTTNHFQKHSEDYKILQRLIADNLTSKDKQTRETNRKARRFFGSVV